MAVDGVLILNKPVGITSAKALYRVRKVLGQRKSGHGGTLDPGATGVLLILLGKATKLTESIMDLPKVYRASARLDVTSESYDSDYPLTPIDVQSIPTEQDVRATAGRFVGEIQQTPPAISAIKIGGRPAYKLARKGDHVELKPRQVHIYWLTVHRYAWPELDFEMCCSRGTYVRSLIRDWGAVLGCGGCLTSLNRSAIGPFTLGHAVTLEALDAAGAGDSLLDLPRAKATIEAGAGCVPPPPK